MSIRRLTAADAPAAARFALSASFPPDAALPPDALSHPHVRRWFEPWDVEFGVGWEENGELLGAAWARQVEPVIARDKTTGAPLPEVIAAVVEARRGEGVGGKLIRGLFACGAPALALTVSERNVAAVRLYERAGFRLTSRTPAGLRVMELTTPTH